MPRAARGLTGVALTLTWALHLACESEPEVPPPPPSMAVRVVNVANGEIVRHPLVVVDGSAGGTHVVVTRAHAADDERGHKWPVVDGRFRALVPLAKGRNELHIAASDGGRGDLILTHVPDDNARFIRPVYVVASDGDGSFDAEGGEGRDIASARARIETALALLQAFTAEAMADAGFERRSFRVVPLELHKTSLTTAQAQAMTGDALWQHIAQERAGVKDADVSIDLAVLSMTHYDGSTKTLVAHAAHGGERLALFGSATLHTFAPSLDDVLDHFADDRTIDSSAFADDSGGRGTHGAAYATGLGVMLHELGHCLGLAHQKSGVMARAFDHVNRKLTLTEPGHSHAAFRDDEEVGFDRSSAVRLRFHPFITPPRAAAKKDAPTLTLRLDGSAVLAQSAVAVRHIEVQRGADALLFEDLSRETGPSNVPHAFVNVRERAVAAGAKPGEPLKVTAIDDDGTMATLVVP